MGNEESSPNDQSVLENHPLGLTPVDIKTIQKQWKRVRSGAPNEPGKTIILRVFKISPEIRRVFAVKDALYPSSSPDDFTDESQVDQNGANDGKTLKAPENVQQIPRSPSSSSMLNKHAARFTESLDFVIMHLNDVEAIRLKSIELGARHADVRSFGFQPSYWTTFADCLIEQTSRWKQKKNVSAVEAWKTVVDFMIENMRTGYEKEIVRKRALAVL